MMVSDDRSLLGVAPPPMQCTVLLLSRNMPEVNKCLGEPLIVAYVKEGRE